MTRNSMIAAAAGALGGILLVAAWQGSVFGILLGLVFSSVPLMMTVFGFGITFLPVAVAGGAVAVTVLTGSFALTAFYLVFDGLPVAILARIGLAAERLAVAAPAGTIPRLGGLAIGLPVVWLVIAAVALMGTGFVMFPAGPNGLEAGLIERLDQLVTESGVLRDVPDTARAALVKTMARVMPGAAAWNWSFRAIASAVVGQALLARDRFARWPTPAYRTLAVPGWYVGGFWVATIAALLAPGDIGLIVANAAVVMSLPLVLQGLAVVHCAAARFGFGRMALAAFYGVSLVVAGPALVLIVTLGVMEHFSQMRRRMMAQNGG
ncbi:MAG: DUF2232 domain-containing protein [Rhodospirillaceae bacterium]|nr:MAG: DUF2232 domain-containing protein [Rhodospirillaceae bacterium]